ncbi:MAG TPA: hypothetical protein VJ870_19575, partial [Amycolatopsis sp.]|nr:hypothetical protein [Amycolatopsis sp.]
MFRRGLVVSESLGMPKHHRRSGDEQVLGEGREPVVEVDGVGPGRDPEAPVGFALLVKCAQQGEFAGARFAL